MIRVVGIQGEFSKEPGIRHQSNKLQLSNIPDLQQHVFFPGFHFPATLSNDRVNARAMIAGMGTSVGINRVG